VALCDENTIGVIAILGSTFDGSYEPVAEICAALDDLEARTGLNVPVQSTPRAFVAPFVDPDLEWDFRLRAWPRSTRPGTSTGSSTRESAGSSGATRRCRT
jgi:glutamate/tyrosine decarboxylase-like PLP-dependent enzyme